MDVAAHDRERASDPTRSPTARSIPHPARSHPESGRVRLVLVGALPGTGKSTLAQGLGAALGVVVIRSNVVGEQLAGLEPGDQAGAPFGEGRYTPAVTAATYAEALRRAEETPCLGETVILDASWSDRAHRAHRSARGGGDRE